MHHYQDTRRAYPSPRQETRPPRGNTRNLRGVYEDYEPITYQPAPPPRRVQPARVPAQLNLYAISMLVFQEVRKRGLLGDHVWTEPLHEVHIATAKDIDEAYSEAWEDIYRLFPESHGYSGHDLDVREADEGFINDLAANRLEIAEALGRYQQ